MNEFIKTLKIPCYDCVKYYYYYDVLEALSRTLFQNLIFEERDEIIEKEEEAELETQKEEHHCGHKGPENKDLQASPKN